MAQQVIHARTIFTSLDAQVDNPSFSTYWEQVGSNTNVNLTTVMTNITTFLNTAAPTATHPTAYYMHPVISRATNAVTVEFYDVTGHLSGSAAGSPISIQYLTLGVAGTGVGYPEGLAAEVGYRCDYGTDVEFAPGTRPRSRDRNRFYFGPLNINAFTVDATTHGSQLHPSFTTDLLKSAGVLFATASGTTDVTTAVVWSKAGSVVKHPIAAIWTHQQPSYQRRRVDEGIKVTS